MTTPKREAGANKDRPREFVPVDSLVGVPLKYDSSVPMIATEDGRPVLISTKPELDWPGRKSEVSWHGFEGTLASRSDPCVLFGIRIPGFYRNWRRELLSAAGDKLAETRRRRLMYYFVVVGGESYELRMALRGRKMDLWCCELRQGFQVLMRCSGGLPCESVISSIVVERPVPHASELLLMLWTHFMMSYRSKD